MLLSNASKEPGATICCQLFFLQCQLFFFQAAGSQIEMVVVREVIRENTSSSSSPNTSSLCPMVAQKATLSHHTLPQSLPPVLGKMDHMANHGQTSPAISPLPSQQQLQSNHSQVTLPVAINSNELHNTSRVSVFLIQN